MAGYSQCILVNWCYCHTDNDNPLTGSNIVIPPVGEILFLYILTIAGERRKLTYI